jgi:hypothetical protein
LRLLFYAVLLFTFYTFDGILFNANISANTDNLLFLYSVHCKNLVLQSAIFRTFRPILDYSYFL